MTEDLHEVPGTPRSTNQPIHSSHCARLQLALPHLQVPRASSSLRLVHNTGRNEHQTKRLLWKCVRAWFQVEERLLPAGHSCQHPQPGVDRWLGCPVTCEQKCCVWVQLSGRFPERERFMSSSPLHPTVSRRVNQRAWSRMTLESCGSQAASSVAAGEARSGSHTGGGSHTVWPESWL